MSLLFASEFRLFYVVLLSALVLAAAWQVARRFEPADILRAAQDALLLFYLVQYLSVCVPGLVGALHPATIALVALLLSSAMTAAGIRGKKSSIVPPVPPLPPVALGGLARTALVASTLFLLGYLGALVQYQRQLPVIANDAITYHLPAAVQWLQTGRLGLYETWFYNPANSYSPLAGSTFAAWLIAPIGNDVLARFVQVGPLIFLFVAMLNLLRAMGMSTAGAAPLALAGVLVRPFVSQTILAKDDLFVAAFFIALVESMRRERLETRVGPWRVGIALGLLLATKYTVLLSLPILLLMLGRGWTWRRAAIAAGTALLLAGPWFVRNAILTGNPLYPTEVRVLGVTIFPGMLHLRRSELLGTAARVWKIFTDPDSYYGVPLVLALIMLGGWLAAWMVAGKRLWSDPLKRTCLIGPVIGIGLFVAAAPYGEMRFTYPALLLLFASSAIALARLPEVARVARVAQVAQVAVGGAMALLAARAAFVEAPARDFIIVGLIAGAAGALAVISRRHAARIAGVAGVLVIAVTGVAVYVYWDAYVARCELDSLLAWRAQTVYPHFAPVWEHVRKELPRGATIAYANTYFTYPLMGYGYDHRVVYAPTRRTIERFVDIPRIVEPTTGEAITGRIVEQLRRDPDRDAWLRRLRESGAAYLVVMKRDTAAAAPTSEAPELGFAAQDPAHFARVYDDPNASIFKITW